MSLAQLIKAARSSGDWTAALADPDASAPTFLEAVRAAQAKEDWANARAFADRGLERAPSYLPLLLASAKEALRVADTTTAIDRLQRYIAADEAAGRDLIEASFEKRKFLQAVCCLVAMDLQFPGDAEAAAWRTRLRGCLKQMESADADVAAGLLN